MAIVTKTATWTAPKLSEKGRFRVRSSTFCTCSYATLRYGLIFIHERWVMNQERKRNTAGIPSSPPIRHIIHNSGIIISHSVWTKECQQSKSSKNLRNFPLLLNNNISAKKSAKNANKTNRSISVPDVIFEHVLWHVSNLTNNAPAVRANEISVHFYLFVKWVTPPWGVITFS